MGVSTGIASHVFDLYIRLPKIASSAIIRDKEDGASKLTRIQLANVAQQGPA